MIIRRFGDWPTWMSGSPFEEIDRLQRQMDRLTDQLWGEYREPRAGVYPLMNVTEDKDHYYVRAELPGVNAKDLDISVTGNSLTIAGERKIPSEGKRALYHRKEREGGTFSRIINVPREVETSKVEARSADGVLTVILPKSEQARPKQIQVKMS